MTKEKLQEVPEQPIYQRNLDAKLTKITLKAEGGFNVEFNIDVDSWGLLDHKSIRDSILTALCGSFHEAIEVCQKDSELDKADDLPEEEEDDQE